MIKRITILLMLAVLVAAPLGTILSSPEGLGQVKDLESLEEYLQDNFWERQPLIDLARWFQLTGGLVERNDVFYSEEGLIEDFQPEDPYAASTVNTREIIHFSESNSCPAALVLIPTARAVKQEHVKILCPKPLQDPVHRLQYILLRKIVKSFPYPAFRL